MPDAGRKSHDLPPCGCTVFAILLSVGIMAWLFKLGGMSFDDWKPLKWLCTVPFVIVGIFLIPMILKKPSNFCKKLRRHGVMEQTESEKELYKEDK